VSSARHTCDLLARRVERGDPRATRGAERPRVVVVRVRRRDARRATPCDRKGSHPADILFNKVDTLHGVAFRDDRRRRFRCQRYADLNEPVAGRHRQAKGAPPTTRSAASRIRLPSKREAMEGGQGSTDQRTAVRPGRSGPGTLAKSSPSGGTHPGRMRRNEMRRKDKSAPLGDQATERRASRRRSWPAAGRRRR